MMTDFPPTEYKVRDFDLMFCWAPGLYFCLELSSQYLGTWNVGERNKMQKKISLAPTQQAPTALDHFHTPDLLVNQHQPLTPLTYLVDSTSKCNPGPLSPTKGHTLLSHLCLVSIGQDLKE